MKPSTSTTISRQNKTKGSIVRHYNLFCSSSAFWRSMSGQSKSCPESTRVVSSPSSAFWYQLRAMFCIRSRPCGLKYGGTVEDTEPRILEKKFLMIDEALLTSSGGVYKRNCHIWALKIFSTSVKRLCMTKK
ncbi:unnamed protein product [Ceratitis capitata]|uniref:(Mediterranean fruit fly) hypothetical protein n=1 Tax=Ceratitis capitata TaxID=7213 RepID=A0A811UHI5_CERCA|nr:unnamed protein product [Ceratitis capitata]